MGLFPGKDGNSFEKCIFIRIFQMNYKMRFKMNF
jgi:hypothetical protein